MQFHRVFTVSALMVSALCVANAQIISITKTGDKTMSCMRSGLSTGLKDCGNRSDWYSYVFVGSISSIKAASNEENEVRITPEEVFFGKPEKAVTVLTSQGWCLPKLAIGDRWLFYLRKVNGEPIVLDYYGNDSLPVADAQKQIETLRRLRNIGDLAILRGRVMRGDSFSGEVLPDAHVIANRKSDHSQFASITDADGRYEFRPLPAGEYKITVKPIGSYQPDGSEIDMKGGACWDLTLRRSPHAEISGHVRRPNGSPVKQKVTKPQ